MKHYKKHVDNFFKEKLGTYRETPPADAWDDLESRLDGLSPGTPPPGTSYRWLLHVAIVSLLFVLSVSLIRKINSSSPAEQETAANTKTSDGNHTAASPLASAATVTSASSNTNGEMANNNASATNSDAQTLIANATNSANNTQQTTTHNTTVPSGKTTARHLTANSNSQHFIAGANAHNRSAHSGNRNSHHTSYNSDEVADNKTDNKNKTRNHTGNLSNPAPDDNTMDAPSTQAASPNTTLSVVSSTEATATTEKKKPVSAPQTSTATNNSRTRTKPGFTRLEAGVKAGYEGGLSNGAANKLVVSPYLQYNVSRKLAIMTQPGIKYAVTPNHNLGGPQNYYDVNPENNTLTQGPTQDSTFTSGSTTTRYYITHYTYSQTHDSIVKSNRIGGSSMQYELPVLLKYSLSKKLAVYGGINFVYNKLTNIIENTYTAKNVTRILDTTVVTTNSAYQPNFTFAYTGNPIQDYKKMTANQTGYQFSTGFMVGFSYAYSKKWLVDMLVEQSPATPDVKAGYNINSPLSATYFRLSVGYKLTK